MIVEVCEGDSPIILGLPHTGVEVPPEIRTKLNETGLALADTDWHIHELYDGLLEDATTVRTCIHRYAIDVNRDPGGASLYPGQNTTTLVPLTDFDGRDIWTVPPTAEDISERRSAYHDTYHAAISEQIARVKGLHGFAILYDCHSIRSQIPFLFDGVLPDFSIGTNEGTTCDPELEQRVHRICDSAPGYTTVLNGRFKGGWTTRHYGHPQDGVHAIQMELAQSTYLQTEDAPFAYDPVKARRLRAVLSEILAGLASFDGTPQ